MSKASEGHRNSTEPLQPRQEDEKKKRKIRKASETSSNSTSASDQETFHLAEIPQSDDAITSLNELPDSRSVSGISTVTPAHKEKQRNQTRGRQPTSSQNQEQSLVFETYPKIAGRNSSTISHTPLKLPEAIGFSKIRCVTDICVRKKQRQETTTYTTYSSQPDPCVTSNPTATPGFRTAGLGSVMFMSKEEMDRATRFLDSSNQHPTSEESSLEASLTSMATATIGFRAAGLGTSIAVSKEDMPKDTRCLDSSNQHATPEEYCPEPSLASKPTPPIDFRTAGLGNTISVSNEEMAKATRLLDTASDRTTAKESYVERSVTSKPTATIGFRTAGLERAISVSEEGIAKA
ncbi:MAG: hypothetical protein SGBAC_011357, partial [Bacillariaceae sp.]